MSIPLISAPILASYNYTDVADGTGLVAYYGIVGPGTTASSWGLVPFLDDGSGDSSGSGHAGDGSTEYNVGSITFNTARTLKSTAYLTCYIKHEQAGGGSSVFKLYHVDGDTSTETLICTFSSLGTSDANFAQRYTSGSVTEKRFGRGDILRLKILSTVTGSNNVYLTMSTTNPFTLYVPFRIDIA